MLRHELIDNEFDSGLIRSLAVLGLDTEGQQLGGCVKLHAQAGCHRDRQRYNPNMSDPASQVLAQGFPASVHQLFRSLAEYYEFSRTAL